MCDILYQEIVVQVMSLIHSPICMVDLVIEKYSEGLIEKIGKNNREVSGGECSSVQK